MAELWGYKIPLHPNDKGVRAAYRANQQHCLMHVSRSIVCSQLALVVHLSFSRIFHISVAWSYKGHRMS